MVSLDHQKNENARLKTEIANMKAKLSKKMKTYVGESMDGKDQDTPGLQSRMSVKEFKDEKSKVLDIIQKDPEKAHIILTRKETLIAALKNKLQMHNISYNDLLDDLT